VSGHDTTGSILTGAGGLGRTFSVLFTSCGAAVGAQGRERSAPRGSAPSPDLRSALATTHGNLALRERRRDLSLVAAGWTSETPSRHGPDFTRLRSRFGFPVHGGEVTRFASSVSGSVESFPLVVLGQASMATHADRLEIRPLIRARLGRVAVVAVMHLRRRRVTALLTGRMLADVCIPDAAPA
jgi:hypothetical protein